MPCEACLVQFTIFRRKRSCTNCRRFYCNNCISIRSKKVLCARCSIFAKRPLLRTELLQLKPKDLIFYLQSKHISTAGCVEKEELVALILHHTQQTDASSNHSDTGSGFSSPSDEATTFDSLKQTCQTFFGNITENISDSFMAFDGRTASGKSQTGNNYTNRRRSGSSTTTETPTNITAQPRVTTREMPTYASSSRQRAAPAGGTVTPTTTQQQSCSSSSTAPSSNGHTSQTASPVVSFDSTASPSQPALNHGVHAIDVEINNCECSDDEEFLTTFTTDIIPKSSDTELGSNANAIVSIPIPSTTNGNGNNPVVRTTQNNSADTEMGNGNREESLHSSFEELGAIGGISDDSKTATDSNSGQWQILDVTQRLSDVGAEGAEGAETDAPKTTTVAENNTENAAAPIAEQTTSAAALAQVKKVTRRRSEGYLNRSHRPIVSDDELSPLDENINDINVLSAALLHQQLREIDETLQQRQRLTLHCRRCGKNKLSIRQHVERMRRHLESSQMSEAEIKRELQAFLSYLEKRTMSMDSDDATETALVSPLATTTSDALATGSSFNDSDGIHVYAGDAPFETDTSRFINLADFESLEELESLTVKQLKEVLMLNRVDYKGCCEKQELFDRVERLWRTLKKAPAVEKLPTDELCKICMDAPIECIILECGHMATCTNCGKVLSECPICRQYIVRVVRFFRA